MGREPDEHRPRRGARCWLATTCSRRPNTARAPWTSSGSQSAAPSWLVDTTNETGTGPGTSSAARPGMGVARHEDRVHPAETIERREPVREQRGARSDESSNERARPSTGRSDHDDPAAVDGNGTSPSEDEIRPPPMHDIGEIGESRVEHGLCVDPVPHGAVSRSSP